MSAAVEHASTFPHGLSCFRLDTGHYAVDLRLVAEINQHLALTPARTAPDWVAGVVNLRGQIVTVLDVARRIGLEARHVHVGSRLIVLKTNADLTRFHSEKLATSPDKIGFLVDAISDVVTPTEEQLEPPPPNLNGVARNFLWGVCKTRERTIGILDTQPILALQEIDTVLETGALGERR